MRRQLHKMRDIELKKIADPAHDNPMLQSEAQKELYARHQEDLERQEELQRELETDTHDLDVAPATEPPEPAVDVAEAANKEEQTLIDLLLDNISEPEEDVAEEASKEEQTGLGLPLDDISAPDECNICESASHVTKEPVSNQTKFECTKCEQIWVI